MKQIRGTLAALLAGARFVWRTKPILATITLDLFAVFLGGATALLPIFADQILHCGPIGLGWMRAAPGIGAFIMALIIAYLPPMKKAGKMLLWCVTGFGAATIIFGLSHYLWLSLAMLFMTGVFDSVSVVIRHTLLQLVTPDAMRGRISSSALRTNSARSSRVSRRRSLVPSSRLWLAGWGQSWSCSAFPGSGPRRGRLAHWIKTFGS